MLQRLNVGVLRGCVANALPSSRLAICAARAQSPVCASPALRWKHRGRSGSEDGDGLMDGGTASLPPADGASATRLTSPEFLSELKEEIEVLKNEIAVVDPTSHSNDLARLDDLPSPTAVSADMLSFLLALRSQDDALKASLSGSNPDQSRDIHMQFPLTPVDHPLLADDFAALPPFDPPTLPAKASNSLKMLNVLANHEEKQAVPNLKASAQFSASNVVSPPGLESSSTCNPLYQYILGSRKVSDTATPSRGTLSSDDKAVLKNAVDMLDRTLVEMDRARVMYMTSVLRKRRKKMNKHKLRKLRKRTRSQRK